MNPMQLAFDFLDVLDQQIAIAAREAEARSKRANTIALFRAIVQRYPLTEHERAVLPRRVRPARFVIRWECDQCPSVSEDHSLGNRFGYDRSRPGKVTAVLICLKDFYEKAT